MEDEMEPTDLTYSGNHNILPNEYPLFLNYQLVGDSQLVRFSELFLNSKCQYHYNSSRHVGYCISGQTAEQLRCHLKNKKWPIYKNIILLIGTNDISNNTEPGQWNETMKKIVTYMHKYNVENFIIVSVPPVAKLWHTVLHWSLFVEYNDILRTLEKTYKSMFNSIRFVDISSIFFQKTPLSSSFYSARLDLFVACPVKEGLDNYDKDFLISGTPRRSSLAKNTKDTSYLKQSISLFDMMNMRCKLMACFFGQTREQDITVNKERFDLIGVTFNDVQNIKANLLAVYNEEYMYILRHVYQKFSGYIRGVSCIPKRDIRGSLDDAGPSKILRTDLLAYAGNDLETSGILCRSFDSNNSPEKSHTERAEHKMPKIKKEISLKESPSTLKRRNSKGNVWTEEEDDRDNASQSGKNTSPSETNTCDGNSLTGFLLTVCTDEKTTQRQVSCMIPTAVVLKQRSRGPISSSERSASTTPILSTLNSSLPVSSTANSTPLICSTSKSTPSISNEDVRMEDNSMAKKRTSENLEGPGGKIPCGKNRDYSDLCETEQDSLLNIDYLTQEEKNDQEQRYKKREHKSRRDRRSTRFREDSRERIASGYDRNFIDRTNTVQFYQFIQRVCKYQTNNDVTPLQEKTFMLLMRNMKNKASDLESKFYSSLLGRYDFYKFMKYISLDYIVPQMFASKYKKVMFTSVVDKDSNVNKYIVRNLDVSVFETHYSRFSSPSRINKPRVDLVHLNQKGFELLRDILTELISRTNID